MPFPADWPPRPASNTRSLRFFQSGSATANFEDSAYMFADGLGANTIAPTPYVPPGSTAPVAFGTLTQSGSPMGGGLDQMPPQAKKIVWSGYIRVCNDSGSTNLEFTFDGTNVHGRLLPNTAFEYYGRMEGGIAVRGAGVPFRIEAW